MIGRPRCQRCGGPLDVFPDGETGEYKWQCNNPTPIFATDEAFEKYWNTLRGDDVVMLLRKLSAIEAEAGLQWANQEGLNDETDVRLPQR